MTSAKMTWTIPKAKTMEESTDLISGQSDIKISLFVITSSILIGLLLSLIVGWTFERFVMIALDIVILNSVFLGCAVLISMYFSRHFIDKIESTSLILLLSFILMLGTGIFSFLGFFVTDPSAFIYSNNRTIPFLLISLLFFISINIISSGFVIFQHTLLNKEKALVAEKVVKTEMKLELEANKRVMDSIQYAKLIQGSLLPSPGEIKKHLPDSFIIWLPRDTVGGDIYFTSFFEEGYALAVIDCTGHGVPGAFMTMLASSGLNKIINGENARNPSEILKGLNYFIKKSLRQDTQYALSDDGLDVSICVINREKKCLTFAGARLPLTYIDKDNNLTTIKGDRQSIGYKKSDLHYNYTSHEILFEDGMTFYLQTDGIIDQLGGNKRFPYGNRRLKELLLENCHLPFKEQQERILKAFEDYKGGNEIQDDISVIGFRV